MIKFAKIGDIEKMTELHVLGVDYNTKDMYGSAAIHFAAQNGHEKCLEFLLDNGVPFDEPGQSEYTPIQFAIRDNYGVVPDNRDGKNKCAIILIQRCHAMLSMAFEFNWAADNGLLELVLEHSGEHKYNVSQILLWLLRDTRKDSTETRINAIKMLLNRDDIKISEDAILRTIVMENVFFFRQLVFGPERIAREDACKLFATSTKIWASLCSESNTDFLLIALENGANALIDCVTKYAPNRQIESTMLYYAAYMKFSKVCDLLLSHGANIWISMPIDQKTVLHVASDMFVVESLLRHAGPRVAEYINIKDHNGQTALHKAAKYRSHDMIELLMANGADNSIQNKAGETAHDLLEYEPRMITSHCLLSVRV